MAGGSIPANLAPIFQAAGRAFNVPPAVLAGVSSVESDLFRNLGPSSTGAQGGMQFEPGTARSLGVNPNDPRSAIFGAAKLLVQYGYHQNPLRAIGAYNGGPGNPQLGYARQVMSEAQRLAPQLHGSSTAPGLTPHIGSFSSLLSSPPSSGPSFDQAGFDQAQSRYLAGSFAKATDTSNPYQLPVKGAAKLSDPLLTSGVLSTTAPNPADFQIAATQQLQKIAGTPLVNVHPGAQGDVNPIAGAVIGRTDMGVDANLKPGAPIRAPNDAKVVGILPGWYAGQPYIAVQLLKGPNAGKIMYVAEQITNLARVGQTLRRGQPIAQYAGSGTGIEIGWASPHNWQQTLAQATTGYHEGQQTQAGANFRSFLGGLGG